MIGRRMPALQRYAVNIARQRFSTSLSPCRAILASQTLPMTRASVANIAQTTFLPIRAIHASGVRRDVIVVEGPAFAESISEGDIRWIKQKGDFVNEDELVAEIETDKVGYVSTLGLLESAYFFFLITILIISFRHV
ncbi:hypothetical protein V3C99_014716 [Haemonchus contortus]